MSRLPLAARGTLCARFNEIAGPVLHFPESRLFRERLVHRIISSPQSLVISRDGRNIAVISDKELSQVFLYYRVLNIGEDTVNIRCICGLCNAFRRQQMTELSLVVRSGLLRINVLVSSISIDESPTYILRCLVYIAAARIIREVIAQR